MPTVAESLAGQLAAAGVRRVFGLPGGETVELLDNLRLAGIDFVLAHSESAAVYMADGCTRVAGGAGVVLTTLGPGATNAVMGVAHAYLDRAPIVIITAQKPVALLPDYTHQVIDLHAVFRPITKWTERVTPDNAAGIISAALAVALDGRPGPVHLQLSNEDAALPLTEHIADHAAQRTSPAPDAAAIGQARRLLEAARRPVIVAGLGLEPQRPYARLAELAEALDAPVVVTPKAKGALPDTHPLSAGVVGLTRTDPVYAVLDEADCVLAVGFDVVELVKPWQTAAPLIWLAPWLNHDPAIPAAVELCGDLADLLAQLSDGDYRPDPAWGAARVAAHRNRPAPPLPTPQPGRLLPQQVLAALAEHLPADAQMTVDVGSHKIYASLDWPTRTPNTFFVSNGLSSMSFGLPAALGAQMAAPGRATVCLTGDAGMAMVMGELGVMAQRQLPVLVVVLNDGAIDLIRSHQVRSGKPVFGTEFRSPNFAVIAAAYGLESARITDLVALHAQIATYVERPYPLVLEVMLDPVGYPTTPPSHRPASL
jgi:acetolactate synthase-1/2/3 large subunit